MFGLHSGRNGVGSVLILSGLVTAMLSGPVSADGSSVKSEKGSGISENAVASDHVVPTGKERMTIVISDDRPPAFVQAKDGAGTTTTTKQVFGNGDLLSIKRDVELAQQGAAPANGGDNVRLAPPTAIDLLGHRDEPQAKTAVAVLPSVSPPVQTPAARPQSGRIEQAQFAPGALGVAKSIMPPRTAEEAEVGQGQSPVFLPSPRKPDVPMGATQEVALVPHVGEAPKAAALRQAPSPDNQQVELVETPSDQALKLSAGRGQLISLGTAVTDIFVADPSIADVKVVSPQKLFVHGNQLGRTNIFGIGSNGDVVFGLDLQVVPDADVAQAQLKALSPNGDTNIQLVSDQLVAGGTVNDVGEALQVAALSDQLTATEGPTANNTVISGSQQVNLRVRFAEVTRDDVVNLGVNWNALGNTGDFLIGLSNGPDVGDVASLAGSLAGDSSTSGGIPGTGDINVEAFIDALHQEGIISLLAEPNLTAINGETGHFLAGSEIPILVPGGGGDGTTTIEYKQVGVSLEYVPTLLPGNRINLRIRPEVSSPSAAGGVVIDGFAIPAFTVRRTETSVELASGQTMALAGLFQRDVSTDVNKFPVLGDLPILGKLFRSERYQRSETELVILITPYLVEPTNNPNIALPNERIDAQRKPLAQQTQKRRAGFIVN
ncbi:MAG: pilus assembly protein N-terminal domain-containing protein [Geminicoccales bacterium]